jgi:hypothetical protein
MDYPKLSPEDKTIYEKLEKVIISKHNSLRQFASEMNIPFAVALNLFSYLLKNMSKNEIKPVCPTCHNPLDHPNDVLCCRDIFHYLLKEPLS